MRQSSVVRVSGGLLFCVMSKIKTKTDEICSPSETIFSLLSEHLQSGGARYPYPKEVWTPSGEVFGPLRTLKRHPSSLLLTIITIAIIPRSNLSPWPVKKGGWWTQPKNWKTNTAIVGGGILVVLWQIWSLSARIEVCMNNIFPISPSSFFKRPDHP